MTVKVRPYTKGGKNGWEVDIMLTIPGRPRIRERKKAPVATKAAAKRWGEERERQLIQYHMNRGPDDEVDSPDVTSKEVPTVAQFVPRYLEGYCEANRLRPSTILQRTENFANHIIPALGRKRLDRISTEDIQRFKAERSHLNPSTVNQILTLLQCVLNVAVEWKVIQALPLKVRKLKEGPHDFTFYDFVEFDRLVLAAERMGSSSRLVMMLLGGEAGLRSGEMKGLRWSDIDFKRDILTVSRTIWRGHEGPPKGGRSRTIPLAPRLRAALAAHRHIRADVVLVTRRNKGPGDTTIRNWLNDAQRKIGFETTGPHVLRHTFCSHLAMAGKPVGAIQAFAGHASVVTTQRYMHLAPAAARDAIEGLRRPAHWRDIGDASSTVLKLE